MSVQQHDACRGVGWGGVRMSSPTAEEPARGALLAYIAGLVVLRFNVQMVFHGASSKNTVPKMHLKLKEYQ